MEKKQMQMPTSLKGAMGGPQGLNADPSQFSSEDFLTQKDMASQPQATAEDIPDLHHEEKLPNSNRRNDINKHIDSINDPFDKEMMIQQNIRDDIEKARYKYENVPNDPINVLKQLIAKGEYKETFEYLGQKWTIRALDQHDLLLAMEEINDDMDSTAGRITAGMFGQVLYSLEEINGVPIYKMFPDIKLEDYNGDRQEYFIAIKRALRSYLAALPPAIIENLFTYVSEIEEKRNKALEDLKN